MKTECTCGARPTKKRAKLRTLEQGDRLVRYSEEYIVAQVKAAMFMLVSLGDGNRWTDGAQNIEELTNTARNAYFTLKGDIS